MNTFRKIIAVMLVLAALAVSVPACAKKESEPEIEKKKVTVEGSIFGGQNEDKIGVEVSFDTKWITTDKNTVYNPELAKFCAVLSADSYFREKDLAKGRQNRAILDENADAEYAQTSLLKAFGFTETEHYESYLALEDPTDSNDSVTLNVGHQTVGGKYDVYVVVVRGCFSWQEWCSAFDPGCADADYETLTGKHPEWTHKDYFKGIDIAANRALDFISSFMAKNGDEKLPDTILITGHSRGGSIANILGADFENDKDVKSYTYTFNAMASVSSKLKNDYTTVFNVFDEGDFFVDPFPFGDGSFQRFGIDKSVKISGSEEAKEAIAAIKGRDDYASVPETAADEYRAMFASRFENRDMLTDSVKITRVFDNEASANAEREEILSLVGSEKGLGLEDLSKVGEVVKNADGKYEVTFEYCGLALLRSFAKILAYGTAASDAFRTLFEEDETASAIAAWIAENLGAINSGHLLVNGYAIADLVK